MKQRVTFSEKMLADAAEEYDRDEESRQRYVRSVGAYLDAIERLDLDAAQASLPDLTWSETFQDPGEKLESARFRAASVSAYVSDRMAAQGVAWEMTRMLQEMHISAIRRENTLDGLYEQLRMIAADAIQRIRSIRQDWTGDVVITRCREYILFHSHEPMTIASIAEALEINPQVLARKYRRETGEDLKTAIMRTKMEDAERMVRMTDMPMSLIAENAGYSSQSQFTRVFTRAFGVTPSAYRAQGLKYVNKEKPWMH